MCYCLMSAKLALHRFLNVVRGSIENALRWALDTVIKESR